MTKEEKIQEAYGEYYDEMKPWINKNGWFNKNAFYQKKFSFYYEQIDVLFVHWGDLMMPISIEGIENNNGWIKIESEDDLPKEDGFYWAVDSETKDIIDRYFDTKSYDYFNQFTTHYQPIEKPKPPLF